jgi:hypothetical protein
LSAATGASSALSQWPTSATGCGVGNGNGNGNEHDNGNEDDKGNDGGSGRGVAARRRRGFSSSMAILLAFLGNGVSYPAAAALGTGTDICNI